MARVITVGAAQLGPIARDEPRSSAVERMVVLLRQAKERGCDLAVFPELALTCPSSKPHPPTLAVRLQTCNVTISCTRTPATVSL